MQGDLANKISDASGAYSRMHPYQSVVDVGSNDVGILVRLKFYPHPLGYLDIVISWLQLCS